MEAAKSMGGKISSFSQQLFSSLSSSSNLVYSPASIYIALAMAALGASGETLAQFKKTLNFESSNELSNLAKNIQSSLLAETGQPQQGIQISIANKVFSGLKEIRKEYTALMVSNFKSAFENVDFENACEQVRLQINQWVLQVTNDKIKDLLGPGTITSLTKMVLVNAIYFKGIWEKDFNKKRTQKVGFNLEYEEAGKQIFADMMLQENSFQYFESQHFQYISLPYKGQQYRMEIFLPSGGSSLSALEKNLKEQHFIEARKKKQMKKVVLYLPKFKFELDSTDLSLILNQLGLKHPFSDEADFSFMDPHRTIKISNVIHKAIIEVNEEGAEAAAATAVVFAKRCALKKTVDETITMVCNHPFLFSIIHEPTQAELFFGKITNPTKN